MTILSKQKEMLDSTKRQRLPKQESTLDSQKKGFLFKGDLAGHQHLENKNCNLSSENVISQEYMSAIAPNTSRGLVYAPLTIQGKSSYG